MEFENPYIVYVKVDSNGYITAVNSSAFLTDTAGWVEIDRGTGDRFHHAQGNYFPKSITTDSDAYRYKLADEGDKKWRESTQEEIAQQEKALEEQNKPVTEPTVWDELDAAYQSGYTEGYQEGVSTAYDE